MDEGPHRCPRARVEGDGLLHRHQLTLLLGPVPPPHGQQLA
jgi:hypothetical protein